MEGMAGWLRWHSAVLVQRAGTFGGWGAKKKSLMLCKNGMWLSFMLLRNSVDSHRLSLLFNLILFDFPQLYSDVPGQVLHHWSGQLFYLFIFPLSFYDPPPPTHTPKAQATKTKIDKWSSIQWKICVTTGTISRERKAIYGAKVFLN